MLIKKIACPKRGDQKDHLYKRDDQKIAYTREVIKRSLVQRELINKRIRGQIEGFRKRKYII